MFDKNFEEINLEIILKDPFLADQYKKEIEKLKTDIYFYMVRY